MKDYIDHILRNNAANVQAESLIYWVINLIGLIQIQI